MLLLDSGLRSFNIVQQLLRQKRYLGRGMCIERLCLAEELNGPWMVVLHISGRCYASAASTMNFVRSKAQSYYIAPHGLRMGVQAPWQ